MTYVRLSSLLLMMLMASACTPEVPPPAPPQTLVTPARPVDQPNGPSPAGKLPFLQIQAIALAAVPGDVVQVDLEEDHGRDIYEFKILTAQGRVIELELDAATGRILKREAD
ncbi:hypothetical protein PbB2_03017 [Candidatus Phycosocius bacilliformis]|uniref:PepSY domain-containing protein n=1 Tax=Candidatus Phycosocius bacilliformis TaxID=1445552 RepID=A0A2P2EE32_9PROT|nr:PepSY domain-containing protein [Candidatus Phycosocius bacilliformis]GBF59322.1 hypothetical protein PbB2_03017 [Candidatus Phycosocius bacilliformis]